MCSPVEHYFCFNLIFFLYEFEDVPRKAQMSPEKLVFGVVPSKNDKLCPWKSGLSSSYLSPVKKDNRCPRKSGLSSLYYCLARICNPRGGGGWLPVSPILISISWEPVGNGKKW